MHLLSLSMIKSCQYIAKETHLYQLMFVYFLVQISYLSPRRTHLLFLSSVKSCQRKAKEPSRYPVRNEDALCSSSPRRTHKTSPQQRRSGKRRMNSACHYGEGDSLCKNSSAVTAVAASGLYSAWRWHLRCFRDTCCRCAWRRRSDEPDRFLAEGGAITFWHGRKWRSLSARSRMIISRHHARRATMHSSRRLLLAQLRCTYIRK